MTRPTLVLGLGGTGWDAVRASRQRHKGHRDRQGIPARFLGIDLRQDLERRRDEDLVLLSAVGLHETLAHLDAQLNGAPAWANVHRWFPDREQFGHLPEVIDGTGQSRPLGRLALWTSAQGELVRGALETQLDDLRCASRTYGDDRADVLVLASAWGGSGSAWLLDIAGLLRRSARVRRTEVLLALPDWQGDEHVDEISQRNAFATLIDLVLAARLGTEGLGIFGDRCDRGRGTGVGEVECSLVVRASGASASSALAGLASARLQTHLAAPIAKWRSRHRRVQFHRVPVPTVQTFHASGSALLSLVQIDEPALIVDEELEAAGFEPLTKASAEAPTVGDLDELEREVESLARDRIALLEGFATSADTNPDRPSSEESESATPAPTTTWAEGSPLLEPPAPIDSRGELAALLKSTSASDDLGRLEGFISNLAARLGQASDTDWRAIAEDRRRALIASLPSTPPDARSREWLACVDEMRRFERALDDLPILRRIPLAARLKHRNDGIWRRLVGESIRRNGWVRALEPVLKIGALALLEKLLPAEPPEEEPRVVEPISSDEKAASCDKATDDPGRQAIRRMLHDIETGMPEEHSEGLGSSLRSHLDEHQTIRLLSATAETVEQAIASCAPRAFTGRVTTGSEKLLVALVPDDLYWPEGLEALRTLIRQQARDRLGARAKIVEAPGDAIVIFCDEVNQPLENIAPLGHYRCAYASHAHPATLHVDRRLIEHQEATRLLADLEPATARSREEDRSEPGLSADDDQPH